MRHSLSLVILLLLFGSTSEAQTAKMKLDQEPGSSEVGDGDVPEGVGAATGLKMINRE